MLCTNAFSEMGCCMLHQNLTPEAHNLTVIRGAQRAFETPVQLNGHRKAKLSSILIHLHPTPESFTDS